MNILLIGGAILFLGGILFPLFKYLREIRKDNNKINVKKKQNVNKKEIINNFDNKFDKDVNICDSRDLLEFDEIIVCNEDEAILKVSENEYLAFIEVGGVSYNLLSIEERLSLEEAYGTLLNGVDFEFQKYIQTRSLNLDNYITKYEIRVKELEDKLKNLKYKVETAKNTKAEENYKVEYKKLENQLEYAYKLLKYFKEKYVESKLLERKYYIIVSYFHNPSEYEEMTDLEKLKIVYSNLYNKVSLFIDSFQRMNMSCKFLDAMGIAELQYRAFNRDEAGILKLENAVKAKYNHLCTTATPIYVKQILEEKKKVEEEQKEIEEKIKDKLEKIRELQEMEVTK